MKNELPMEMKSMKYKFILYIVNEELTKCMRRFDMCHEHKVFCINRPILTFKTTTKVNKNYIEGMIEKSWESMDIKIAAIEYRKKLYWYNKISELSDGICSIINPNVNWPSCD